MMGLALIFGGLGVFPSEGPVNVGRGALGVNYVSTDLSRVRGDQVLRPTGGADRRFRADEYSPKILLGTMKVGQEIQIPPEKCGTRNSFTNAARSMGIRVSTSKRGNGGLLLKRLA
jgi:hypothetical protein